MSLEDITKGIHKEAFLNGDPEEQNVVLARFKEELENTRGEELANHLALRMRPIDGWINFEKSQLVTFQRENPLDQQGIDRHCCRVEMIRYFKDHADIVTLGGIVDLLEIRGVPLEKVSEWTARGVFFGNGFFRPAVLIGYPELAGMIWKQVDSFLNGRPTAQEDILKAAELHLKRK